MAELGVAAIRIAGLEVGWSVPGLNQDHGQINESEISGGKQIIRGVLKNR